MNLLGLLHHLQSQRFDIFNKRPKLSAKFFNNPLSQMKNLISSSWALRDVLIIQSGMNAPNTVISFIIKIGCRFIVSRSSFQIKIRSVLVETQPVGFRGTQSRTGTRRHCWHKGRTSSKIASSVDIILLFLGVPELETLPKVVIVVLPSSSSRIEEVIEDVDESEGELECLEDVVEVDEFET